MSIAKTIGRGLLYLAFNLLVAGAIIEIIFVSMLHAPRLTAASPAPVRRLVQQVPALQSRAHPVQPGVRALRCRRHVHAEAAGLHVRQP
jgi:hypothetical protein